MQILSKFCHNKHLTQLFCTRNAFMTILSSRVILPITMHINALLFNSYFYKKQVVIHKKYYYKLKG